MVSRSIPPCHYKVFCFMSVMERLAGFDMIHTIMYCDLKTMIMYAAAILVKYSWEWGKTRIYKNKINTKVRDFVFSTEFLCLTFFGVFSLFILHLYIYDNKKYWLKRGCSNWYSAWSEKSFLPFLMVTKCPVLSKNRQKYDLFWKLQISSLPMYIVDQQNI